MMKALQALLQRSSSAKLSGPAPQSQQLDNMFFAAWRAADHGGLRPWRFIVVEGAGLTALGALFESAALSDDPCLEPVQRARFARMPLRAPMIVIAIACCRPHPKVPEVEQLIAAGAAVQNMITAAYAQGVGAYWRTGAMAYHPVVAEGLGVAQNEQLIGFIYLGTPEGRKKPVPEVDRAELFTRWTGK